MFNNKRKNSTTYGIVGLGRFGYALATEIAELTDNALVIKSLDKKALMDTGIQNCDVAVVCIGEHMDSSILTTLHLVSMGIPRVIAKATSAEHGEILEKLGAEVVYPERDMAVRLANRLEASKVLDFVQLSERVNISKQLIPEQFIGKTVLEINLRSRFGLNIIVIENNGTVIDNITPDYVFRKNDILFLSGSKDGFMRLSEST